MAGQHATPCCSGSVRRCSRNEHKLGAAASPACLSLRASSLQVFVPVYSVSMAQHLALQLWDFSASLHKSEFERVADLALACMLLDQVDGRGEPSSA